MKRKWWVRWYGCWETLGPFTLYTPWWESGMTMDEPERQIFCAAIWADDEEEVEAILYRCYDKTPEPYAIEVSFCESLEGRDEPWKTPGGRFRWAEWMEPYWARGEYRQEEA